MKWSDLTLEEKAGVMNIAVNNGITNLSDIRKLYNSYAEGGNTDKSYIEDYLGRDLEYNREGTKVMYNSSSVLPNIYSNSKL